MRPLSSYHRIQKLVSSGIRGRGVFIDRKRISGLDKLNIGCGRWPDPHFVNLDYHWMPGVDVCWDLCKPLPFPDGRFTGIYSEHCIDGLPPQFFEPNLREMHRVLAPGGTLRLVFCDSELYVRTYMQRLTDRTVKTPFMDERGHATGMEALDWIFHHHTHRTLVDMETLELRLKQAGFATVTRADFRQGRDAALLIDRPERRAESLYVEAVK